MPKPRLDFSGYLFLVLSTLTATCPYAEGADQFAWKNNTKAAVSITIDDGWITQLDEARILDEFNIKATFYLAPGARPAVEQNIAHWKSVFEHGHEIANHTYSHSCRFGRNSLSGKTWSEVAADVDHMESWLRTNIYGDRAVPHTFAYPCGQQNIGPADDPSPERRLRQRQVGTCEYSAVLSRTFVSARTASPFENQPNNYYKNRLGLGAFVIKNEREGLDVIHAAMSSHGWAILVFHSLGEREDSYRIDRRDFLDLVSYLAIHKKGIWVAPVVTVSEFIANHEDGPKDWSCMIPDRR